MKTEFELDTQFFIDRGHSVTIIGEAPDYKPYVGFHNVKGDTIGWIKDKDLERFAVNILKALKSKKLK